MRSSLLLIAATLCILFAAIQAHLCLINVKQRGGPALYNEPGSHSCFQNRPPCGKEAPDSPTRNIVAGGKFNVRFQQNLNHYAIGYPGYLEVSFSTNPAPTSDQDFVVLERVSDYYPFRQWTQTNFTIPVDIPNQDCEHCILRLRYVPHKPSEPIFHQCADVQVKRNNTLAQETLSVSQVKESKLNPLKKTLGTVYALQYDANQQASAALLAIDAETSQVTSRVNLESLIVRGVLPSYQKQGEGSFSEEHINKLSNRRLLSQFLPSIANAVGTVDPKNKVVYYLVSATSQDPDAFPDRILYFNLEQTPRLHILQVQNLAAQIVSLNYDGVTNTLVAVQLVRGLAGGLSQFQVSRIDTVSGILTPIFGLPAEDTYVDFLFTTLNEQDQIAYVLRRHEDEGVLLTQRLYTVDLKSRSLVADVEVNATDYSYSSIHYSPFHKTLITLSPGPGGDEKFSPSQWNLIKVNATTGVQDFLYRIGGDGEFIFDRYYGGSVFSAVDTTNQAMTHFFSYKNQLKLFVMSTTGPKFIATPGVFNKDVYNMIYVN